jgi:glutamate synthase (NADPH/NADH) large chain
MLPMGGFYRYRNGGELHAWDGNLIHQVQKACATGNYALYQEYAKGVYAMPRSTSAICWKSSRRVRRCNPRKSNRHRDPQAFVTPGMSLGALSPRRTAPSTSR